MHSYHVCHSESELPHLKWFFFLFHELACRFHNVTVFKTEYYSIVYMHRDFWWPPVPNYPLFFFLFFPGTYAYLALTFSSASPQPHVPFCTFLASVVTGYTFPCEILELGVSTISTGVGSVTEHVACHVWVLVNSFEIIISSSIHLCAKFMMFFFTAKKMLQNCKCLISIMHSAVEGH